MCGEGLFANFFITIVINAKIAIGVPKKILDSVNGNTLSPARY
jgi:hypothetical protein